ncbi:hypothetical protein [Geoalkalibacter halelectricus]|uniref:N-acetyltransferase domain-containing protein n=1 Tax=Geoalkalibacter halelectricus TaxID=2847045 RepID=A0ABY5ZP52_9BACT|nr:hypothetical protein [Geoalkalibacter halelectricus]MDO3377187.1 hypothetical protein [Geoalkalibacter halelectricus]UWZ79474.1 hypothetical protein L9S41_17590 [Geoalkalibacter halelectricus]
MKKIRPSRHQKETKTLLPSRFRNFFENEDLPVFYRYEACRAIHCFERTRSFSVTVMTLNWRLIGTFDVPGSEKLSLYRLNNSAHDKAGIYLCLGYFAEENSETRFQVVMSIDLLRGRTLAGLSRNGPLVMVNAVSLQERFKGAGVAEAVFTFLVNEQGCNLLSDDARTVAPNDLWQQLAAHFGLLVDEVDLRAGIVLNRNILWRPEQNDPEPIREGQGGGERDIRFVLFGIREPQMPSPASTFSEAP